MTAQRRDWLTFWALWISAVLLVSQQASPAACRLWWRDSICYPAAEARYHRDGEAAIRAAFDASMADYPEGGQR